METITPQIKKSWFEKLSGLTIGDCLPVDNKASVYSALRYRKDDLIIENTDPVQFKHFSIQTDDKSGLPFVWRMK